MFLKPSSSATNPKLRVLPDGIILIPDPVKVIGVDPEVLLLILVGPLSNDKDPSLVIDPSTSEAVIVSDVVPPPVDREMPDPATNCTSVPDDDVNGTVPVLDTNDKLDVPVTPAPSITIVPEPKTGSFAVIPLVP